MWSANHEQVRDHARLPRYFIDNPPSGQSMHRSIDGHKPCNLFILTKDYSKKFTTNKLLTIEHMAMFVVKSIHI